MPLVCRKKLEHPYEVVTVCYSYTLQITPYPPIGYGIWKPLNHPNLPGFYTNCLSIVYIRKSYIITTCVYIYIYTPSGKLTSKIIYRNLENSQTFHGHGFNRKLLVDAFAHLLVDADIGAALRQHRRQDVEVQVRNFWQALGGDFGQVLT